MRAHCLSLRSSRPGFTNPDVVGADSGFRVQSGAELRSASLLSAPPPSCTGWRSFPDTCLPAARRTSGGTYGGRTAARRQRRAVAAPRRTWWWFTAAGPRSERPKGEALRWVQVTCQLWRRWGQKNHEVCFTAVFTVIFTGFKLQFRGNLIWRPVKSLYH